MIEMSHSFLLLLLLVSELVNSSIDSGSLLDDSLSSISPDEGKSARHIFQ